MNKIQSDWWQCSIHITKNKHLFEMWFFHSLWIVFLETSRRFDLSSRSQCHRTLCFTWQHQSANQRATMYQKKSERSHIHKEKRSINDPWTGIPAAPDLPPAQSCFLSSSRERIHHVSKTSIWDVETSWSFKKHNPKWVKKSHFNIMNIGSNNTLSKHLFI